MWNAINHSGGEGSASINTTCQLSATDHELVILHIHLGFGLTNNHPSGRGGNYRSCDVEPAPAALGILSRTIGHATGRSSPRRCLDWDDFASLDDNFLAVLVPLSPGH